ncbi:MAG: hypothetical protein AAF439_02195 [Pseudomonadota bacterium]
MASASYRQALAVLFAAAMTHIAAGHAFAGLEEVYPKTIAPECGGIHNVYDSCRDQFEVLAEAKAEAALTGKSILVVPGNDVWMESIVLLAYLTGDHDTSMGEYSLDGLEAAIAAGRPEELVKAETLAAYVRENFVLFALTGGEHRRTRWFELSRQIGVIDEHGSASVIVLKDGVRFARLPWESEMPELYVKQPAPAFRKGYDRELLLQELKRLRDAILEASK